jgi:hypothetical protein
MDRSGADDVLAHGVTAELPVGTRFRVVRSAADDSRVPALPSDVESLPDCSHPYPARRSPTGG